MSSALTYRTFVSPAVPAVGVGCVPNGEHHASSPITTTLICGAAAAVLVDPPLTVAQAEAVGDWIAASGRRLRAIYVTHGDPDHWYGSASLLRRFPDAVVLATAGTAGRMKLHATGTSRAMLWDRQFPGQLPDTEDVHPVVLSSSGFELEGERLIPVEVGHADTAETTVLYVPSLDLVVAGDVVYDNVHPSLVHLNLAHPNLHEADADGIDRWIAALDVVAALHPRHLVCGHADAGGSDDPGAIGETRDYLLVARQCLAELPTDLDFFDAMIAAYPDMACPTALWSSAVALLKEP